MSTSNPSIYKTVSHSIINNTIFWKCVTRPFRCIDENCFNRLRFLANVSTKSQKMHFFRKFRTITQEKNLKTRQMTPFFSSTFSAPTVCNIPFWIWKYPKFIFMWSPLWSILVCKILQFLAKSSQFGKLKHTFLKSRHPDVTKNLHYVLISRRSQIPIFFGIQLMD